MSEIKSFRDLIVWQKSVDMVTTVYECTKSFPKDELYGIVSQIRRSAVSVPSNIAEGYGRRSTQDYIRFLQIALGSLYELQTQLIISMNLKFLTKETLAAIDLKLSEIEKMLISLIKKLDK